MSVGGLIAMCVRPTIKKSIWTVSIREWLVVLVIFVGVGRPVIRMFSQSVFFLLRT